MIIPRYNELKVINIWPLVREVNELMSYFPDYEQKQLPDRKFMFSILGTLRPDELKAMVEGARKSRALKEEKPDDDFVYIENLLYKEISSVMAQKSKLKILNVFIATKGKAAFLLKRSSKLGAKRKQAKKYALQYKSFGKEEQKENYEENDEMN